MPEPVDFQGSLQPFLRNGDDGIDRFDGRRFLRSTPGNGRPLAYLLTANKGVIEEVSLTIPDGVHPETVIPWVKRTFLAAPPDLSDLRSVDAAVDGLVNRFPGIRPALQHDLFTALIRSISAQQVNLRWATTTRRRLAETFGQSLRVGSEFVLALRAESLAQASPADVRALQFTTKKAEAIVGLAQEMASGALRLEDLLALPDEDVIGRLIRLKGIGLWSAEWILSRTLGRPRVVAGDLGVRKAVGRLYFQGALPSEADVRQTTAHWGASASIVQGLALHALALGPREASHDAS